MALSPKEKKMENDPIIDELEKEIDKKLKQKDSEDKNELEFIVSKNLSKKLTEKYGPNLHQSADAKSKREVQKLNQKYTKVGWKSVGFWGYAGEWTINLSKLKS